MSVIRKIQFTRQIIKKTVAPSSTISKKNFSIDASNFILQSDVPDVVIPKISVDEFVFLNAHKFPNHIATECAVTGRNYTYEQVRNKSINLNRALRRKLKLQKGDVLAVLLPNCPEFVIAATGALRAGLVVTTLNPTYTPDEISRQLKDSGAKAIITLVNLHQLAKDSAILTKTQIPILTIKTQNNQSTPDGTFNFGEFTDNIDFPDIEPPNFDEVALLPYSSGTTGLPKGVELTHNNIVSNICQFEAKDVGVILETTKDHQDVVPAVLPKFHIYGLVVNTLSLLSKGCKTVSIPKFSPDLYVKTLKKHHPDVLFLAPPTVLFLAGHPSVKAEDLQSIRTVVSAAAPLGALDEERFLHKAQKNINMLQGYGLTETSPVVTMTSVNLKHLKYVGSIGRPVPQTSLKIIDPNDPSEKPLGPNQNGELIVKGPQVMKGYHNRVKETQEVFTNDGWFRTGDIAYYNEDKILFITDRLKELIKVKGFQVPPAELEEIIRDYPDVDDAAVIGISHETQGEVPRAYIVQKPGKTVDKNKLMDYMANRVAPYKQLHGGIEIVDNIPKNPAGKILRKALKQQYEENRKK